MLFLFILVLTGGAIAQSSSAEIMVTVTLADPVISVAPTTAVHLGEINTRLEDDRSTTFAVTNVGSGTLSGEALLSGDTAYYSVVGEASYSLAQEHSAEIVIKFTPDADCHTTKTCTVTFSGGGGAVRDVDGYCFTPHLADKNYNKRLEISEVTSYASDWLYGVHDCISCVTNASFIWSNGEDYEISEPVANPPTGDCADCENDVYKVKIIP